MYLGEWQIDDVLTFTVTTHTFATGALTDADGDPAYRVYEDETGTAILTGTMAKLDDANTTGHYSEQITLSAANGFEVGKSYSIYITAAVSSVTGGAVRSFQVEAAPATASALTTVSGLVDDLEGRLTATRAGYLDNLSAGAVALEATAQTVLADTNELQGDWANGGRLDVILDARASQTSVDDLPTNSELATALAAADDATLAAIAALNNLSAAQVNAEVVDVLRTDTIPDSYATDGAQPTIAQALLMVWQFLSERAVSGTTVTVKKPDGSTSAMTFTLSDATDPASITRAS